MLNRHLYCLFPTRTISKRASFIEKRRVSWISPHSNCKLKHPVRELGIFLAHLLMRMNEARVKYTPLIRYLLKPFFIQGIKKPACVLPLHCLSLLYYRFQGCPDSEFPNFENASALPSLRERRFITQFHICTRSGIRIIVVKVFVVRRIEERHCDN